MAPFDSIAEAEAASTLAERALDLARDVYPLCRSITGDGVRETMRRLAHHAPLEIFEVPSGTPVFDWEIPLEWNLRDAWIATADGRKLVDVNRHALHVMSYSVPVRARMTLQELRPHLHTLPDHPDRIPYRTSYYREAWGFCVAQRELDAWPDGEYEVVIDSTLKPGSLTYAECLRTGRIGAGGTGLHAYLPSRAGQRQRDRHGCGGGTGRGNRGNRGRI